MKSISRAWSATSRRRFILSRNSLHYEKVLKLSPIPLSVDSERSWKATLAVRSICTSLANWHSINRSTMPSPFNIRARRKERKGAESTEPTSSKGVASAPSLTHVSSPSSLSQSSTQPLSDKSISQQPSSDQRSQLNISQIPSSDTSSQEHTSE